MDSLFMSSGLHGLGSSITVSGGLDARPCPSQFSAVGRSPAPVTNAISVDKGSDIPSSFNFSAFNYPFRSLFSGGSNKQSPKGVALDDAVSVEREEGCANSDVFEPEGQSGNWVLKILHASSLWSSDKQAQEKIGGEEREIEGKNGNYPSSSCDDTDGGGCRVSDDDEKVEFDRDSFSKLLKKVSLAEAKLYVQMSYLGSLAYDIPKIKPGNLLKRHGLRFVTSSVEKRKQLEKEQLANAEAKVEQEPAASQSDNSSDVETAECADQKNETPQVSASTAFQVAASAASYLHARTRSIITLRYSNDETGQDTLNETGVSSDNLNINSEMASLMATTDSVTAAVVAKEEVKQAVVDDLNSINSSPCEWFVCDDDKSATRLFVIQGSEKLESWKANLLFEPILFEGLDVFVHRGIYEAAKGMYQQMLPEVHDHMKTHGRHAKFRFTGHSLGGSLSLLINLMLLMRGEVPYSSLLPVITFGSPCVMCGGDDLLRKLGLPKSHIQAIVMHRDIVPRAFSCNYPKPAAELLKAVNGNFRNHPCLNNQKLLYTPMGEMLILQPDGKVSPQHDLLPPGSGLYLLTCKVREAEKQLREAKKAFLNIPHPLEILSDRAAYGNDGTIQRDHDMNSYLRCVRSVIREEIRRMRKAKRERRKKVWWPLLTTRVMESHSNVGHAQLNFLGMMRTGRESLKRFSRLVASQHMHMFLILLFPARMLLIGAFSVINPR